MTLETHLRDVAGGTDLHVGAARILMNQAADHISEHGHPVYVVVVLGYERDAIDDVIGPFTDESKAEKFANDQSTWGAYVRILTSPNQMKIEVPHVPLPDLTDTPEPF